MTGREINIQTGPKRKPISFVIASSNIHWVSKFCYGPTSNKLAIKWHRCSQGPLGAIALKNPRLAAHQKLKAGRTYSMCTIRALLNEKLRNTDVRLFSTQGSTATRLRCGEIFNYHCTENVLGSVKKINWKSVNIILYEVRKTGSVASFSWRRSPRIKYVKSSTRDVRSRIFSSRNSRSVFVQRNRKSYIITKKPA